ncbi:MAG: beta-galactosidase, partial [Kiritimatiellaeota bacterium]|nr:beta-galactosidase [Kiritimatiellota bacterium]
FTPFFAEIGGLVKPGGTAAIVVRARDDNRVAKPSGKQSNGYHNAGCHYTRTTGIWQTVWLEPLPAAALERPRITPVLGGRKFHVEAPVSGPAAGLTLTAILRDPRGEVARVSTPADADFAPTLDLPIPEDRLRLWEPGKPFLYDITFELTRGAEVVDRAKSYAGMRSVSIDGPAVKINGRPVFQRQVLDQGYYPGGIMTAPSDAALRRDIQLAMEAGFNAARLHQKVFEERFLWHADRMGYMVWGEFGDWGLSHNLESTNPAAHQPMAAIMAQWQEVLLRDYNHPCVVGWCPLNETAHVLGDDITAMDDATLGLYNACKACDRTRPVLDASGYSHRVPSADVYDSHDYAQEVDGFRRNHAGLAEGRPFVNSGGNGAVWSVPYAGQPYFCSEFGGIWWNPKPAKGEASWGYGERPKTLEEFYTRFEGLCAVLLDNPRMFGYCYTQLTDVFQEQNGIYAFDRSKKFDLARIRAAQTRRAGIEE